MFCACWYSRTSIMQTLEQYNWLFCQSFLTTGECSIGVVYVLLECLIPILCMWPAERKPAIFANYLQWVKHTRASKYYSRFSRFNIEQSIALTNKSYTSLDSPAHKEYKNLCLATIERTKQKLQALIYNAIKMKGFIVISLLKQT